MANQIQLGILNSSVHSNSAGGAAGAPSPTQDGTDAFAQAVEKLAQAADKLAKSDAIHIIT